MERQNKLNLMKDVLEHLRGCYEQWIVADASMERYFAESMKRDLDEFRRLCDSLSATPEQRRRAICAA